MVRAIGNEDSIGMALPVGFSSEAGGLEAEDCMPRGTAQVGPRGMEGRCALHHWWWLPVNSWCTPVVPFNMMQATAIPQQSLPVPSAIPLIPPGAVDGRLRVPRYHAQHGQPPDGIRASDIEAGLRGAPPHARRTVGGIVFGPLLVLAQPLGSSCHSQNVGVAQEVAV